MINNFLPKPLFSFLLAGATGFACSWFHILEKEELLQSNWHNENQEI